MVMRIGQLRRRMSVHVGLLGIIAFLALLKSDDALKITNLSVPRWVENGTDDSIVLDCEYEYSDSDIKLVVKWFVNDNPEPIYQWIPELNKRHVSTDLSGRLDMKYEASPSNNYTKYRALSFVRPTTELSGKYSCHVTSIDSQDSLEDVMTVYAPARSFDFNYTRTDDNTVNFTCEADGVYPLPYMEMYQQGPEEITPSIVEEVDMVKFREDAVYRVLLTTEIPEDDLPDEGLTFFDCIITLPGTDYRNKKRIAYSPDNKQKKTDEEEPNNTSSSMCLSQTLVLTSTVILRLLW